MLATGPDEREVSEVMTLRHRHRLCGAWTHWLCMLIEINMILLMQDEWPFTAKAMDPELV